MAAVAVLDVLLGLAAGLIIEKTSRSRALAAVPVLAYAALLQSGLSPMVMVCVLIAHQGLGVSPLSLHMLLFVFALDLATNVLPVGMMQLYSLRIPQLIVKV